MRRFLGRFALAVAVVGATTVVGPPAASAALEDCARSTLCGWSQPGYTGSMTTYPIAVQCVNSPFPIRSAANTWPSTGLPVVMGIYSGFNCTGMVVAVLGGGESTSFLPTPGASVSTPA